MPNSIMLSPDSVLGLNRTSYNGEVRNHFAYAVSQGLILVGKILWFLLLVSLLALSVVFWIWVISFRSGWRFWTWVENRDSQQISVGIVYGFFVLLISPFFLFVDWAQKQFDKILPQWMKLPAHFPVRQLFEERLGIKLGEEFPFFIEPEAPDAKDEPKP